ncbi:MAG: PQQ-binding-like beta-propeller repeat protein [Planctomycetes bacterium]|nr:PQQ-binding-like beta-propeller repeat protein [Planctomycetota bacterium]
MHGSIQRSLSVTLLLTTFIAHAARAAEDDMAAMVRTDKPMSLRGEASDWDAIKAEHVIMGLFGEAATFKLAYDEANLYARIVVHDKSPMKNSAGVIEELIKGGDAVGVCLGGVTDVRALQRIMIARVEGKPTILAMRPNWREHKPYTYTSVGSYAMDYVGPVDGAEAGFDEVDGGYAVRVKLPWASLAIKPREGLTLPFDLQVIFSDPAGSMNVATAWWRCDAGQAMSTMDLVTEARLYSRSWGKAKLFAVDPGPRPTPNLLDRDDQAAAFIGPGVPIELNVAQDSHVSVIVRRADGWVVRELLRARRLPAGQYTLYWDGRDRNGQPMPAGKYEYLIGQWDDIKATFAASVGNSGRPSFRTPDGMGSIGGTHGGTAAVAAGEHGVYMLHSGEEGQRTLRCIDPATGKARWFASIGIFARGYAVVEADQSVYVLHSSRKTRQLEKLDAATGQRQKIAGQNVVDLGPIEPSGLAVIGDRAYYSEPDKNRLGVIDLTTGQPLADIALTHPSGMCSTSDGALLVCSTAALLRVEPATGKITTIADKLDAPRAVSVDSDGVIYVALQGTTQQIIKLSAAGKPMGAIGRAGGRVRTAVPYDPMAFAELIGVATGPDGNLWAVEAGAPRRFIKLTRDGRWLEDFYGPTGYTTVGVDLDDASTLYYQPGPRSSQFVKARVDYDAAAKDPGNPVGTWKIEAIYDMSDIGPSQREGYELEDPVGSTGYGRALVFTSTSGHRYFFIGARQQFGLWIADGDQWRPSAAMRSARRTKDRADVTLLWTDANGDGVTQDDEVSAVERPNAHWVWIDRDLTLRGGTADLSPTTINAHGAPVYDVTKTKEIFGENMLPRQAYSEQGNYSVTFSPPGADGARYMATNVGAEAGRNFWDRCSELRVCRVVDGKVKWIIGHHDGRYRHNGDSTMIMNMTGELDGVVMATEVNSNFTAYTTDGLTLGWISRDADDAQVNDGPTAWYVENVQPGLFIKDAKTGRHLLVGVSTEDVRVLNIDGVFGDQIHRTTGSITLASPQPRAAGAPDVATIAYQTMLRTHSGRYAGVDGIDTDWRQEAPAISLMHAGALAAEIRLRRDAGMLYVFADVLAGKEDAMATWPTMELFIGPDAPASRTAAGPGDTQFVFTPGAVKDERLGIHVAGKVNVYRPASEPLAPSPGLRALGVTGNFIGDELKKPLDCTKLTALPGGTVEFRRRLDGEGWMIEAAIPLAALPELTRPRKVSFDRKEHKGASETRLDLAGPMRLNAIIGRGSERIGWTDDAAEMNPARWGRAEAPVDMDDAKNK